MTPAHFTLAASAAVLLGAGPADPLAVRTGPVGSSNTLPSPVPFAQ